MIKNFSQFNEALNISKYRDYHVSNNNVNKDIFMSFFGEHDKNYNRIYIPVKKEKSQTEIEITNLLSKYDYEVTDYVSGRCNFKGAKNSSKINQVLQRLSKQSNDGVYIDSLSKKFVEDPTRKAGNDLMVCISRHAYDIAGSDTDRNWLNCLTIGDNTTQRYKRHIEHIRKELKNTDLKKLGEEIEKMMEEDDDLYEIEKDTISLEDSVVIDELKRNNIDLDPELLCKYEDDDQFVETDNDDFNLKATKYNNIVEEIMKIDRYVVGGGNVKHIKNHIKHGVMMSYLIKSDDKNIKNPIANLDIKPYFNVFDPNEVFFLEDTRMYGHGTEDFRKTVSEWVKSINVGKVGIYRLSDELYNDNLASKQIVVTEGGKVITDTLSYHGNIDSKSLDLYKAKINSIETEEEAKYYINYIQKSCRDIISSDFRIEILMATPKKWKHLFNQKKSNFKW